MTGGMMLARPRSRTRGRDITTCATDPRYETAAMTIKALYVDDDDDMRELVGLALARHGIDVSGASSGEEALPMLAAVDVLIADLGLGGMSGRELCERARERVPIVVVTGDREASQEREELGAREVLIKPVTMEQLADAIVRAVGQRSA